MTRPAPDSATLLDLGVVYLEASSATRLLTLDEPLPPDADLFLGSALARIEKEGGMPRLLFVTAEGPTREAGLVALGLARVAAARGTRVLLADLSVDSPVLAKPFPYQPEEGFVDMVLWGSSYPAVLRKSRNERIGIVCVGSPPPDPDALFEESACDAVLGTFRGENELVVAIGRLRSSTGGASPLLRKADRTLIVRGAGMPVPDLEGVVPADRLILVTLGEELAVTGPAPSRPREAAARPESAPARPREKKRLPVVRVVLAFAGLCILVGLVLSSFYTRYREDAAKGRMEIARGASPAARPAGRPETTRPEAPTTALPGVFPGSPDAGFPLGGGEEVAASRTETPAPVAGEGAGAADEVPPPSDATGPASGMREVAAEERSPAETPKPAAEQPLPAADRVRPPAPVPSGAVYGIHVESFPTRADAEQGAVRFREAGEKVTIVQKEIPEKGTWYRIVIGGFGTSKEANQHAEELKETLGISYALVIRLSP